MAWADRAGRSVQHVTVASFAGSAREFQPVGPVYASSIAPAWGSSRYGAVNVNVSVFVSPAPTVTVSVLTPYFWCHASIV
jgi:hypothetical protein